MTYKRKTEDEWQIEMHGEYGWEVIDQYETCKEAKQALKVYRTNPHATGQCYPYRAIKRRIPIKNQLPEVQV